MEKTGKGVAAPRSERGKMTARLEHQLAAAQQITHIGSWEWDMASNTVSWSDELYRIYGLEPQSCEITFETFLSKLHPDDRARVQSEVGKAIERGGRFSYPERILRPDGSIRDLDTIGETLQDNQGRVMGLIGTCRDVTEERRRDEMIRIYANIGRNVQIGLCVWRVPNPDDAGAATLVTFNPAMEQASGVALAELLGQRLDAVFPGASELPELVARVARDGVVRELATVRFAGSKDGTRIFSAKAFPLPARSVGLALEDVTVRTRALQLQADEQKVLEMIASGMPLSDVLCTLVLTIEQQAPPTIGSIQLLDAEGTRVLHGAAPSLPAAYNQAIDGQPIGERAGSCGTAAFSRKQVVVHDIASDVLWEHYRELALAHGLRACWSTPVLASDGRVLGTFALYYRMPRSPTAEELDLIARATHLAGIAIQRKQMDDQLRALSAHIEAVREEERTAIAREIHDELGQALTALKMDVVWLSRRAGTEAAPLPAVVTEKLEAMSHMTDDIINQVRRISSELRPGVLDDLGLVAAIEWQAQDFEQRTGTICVMSSSVPESTRFERNLATGIFRIFQEALTNVVRHADANRVDVGLSLSGGRLRLEVKDDGKGIEPSAITRTSSLGLLGMRERALRLGGSAEVSGSTGRGTLVVVEVPLAGASK